MNASNHSKLNQELSQFLSGRSDDWGRYTFALSVSHHIKCREERLICAADQFYLCTHSSGLFSYFELQSEHAASGYEAFQALGLPNFSETIATGLALLGLDENASAGQIDNSTSSLTDAQFEHFLNEAEPLEAYICDNAGLILDAIAFYIRHSADKLKRP